MGGARALLRDDIGRLSPGAKADIVLVDLERTHIGPVAADDPIKALVYCAQGSDVDTVIVDGITRVERGQLVGVNLERLRVGAEQFNRKLYARTVETTYKGQPLSEFYEPAFPEWEEVV